MPTRFDLDAVRGRFPALSRTHDGQPVVFFDGPAGSQVPRRVAEAISRYLLTTNANHGGPFATSVESDEVLEAAGEAAADFLGSPDANTVAFGSNMTTMTLAFSRALSRTWQPGDEILLSRLDHDANVTPWVLAARDAGATVRHVAMHHDPPYRATLDLDDFHRQLSDRTRLVAIGAASNLSGTINPVAEITAASHAAGALVFVDAVHLAPHRRIDVAAWGCDAVACSAYKFFGPHVGLLWGRRSLLEELDAYKLRPAPDSLPDKWMTGTGNHEGIAGVGEAIDYLADLGREVDPAAASRRDALEAAFDAIREHEHDLGVRLLEGLGSLPGVTIHGITDPDRLDERVPTVSITSEDHSPQVMAEALAARGIYTWPGNHYAQPATEALGLEPDGTLRIGALHYNTREEVERVVEVLGEVLG